MNASPTDTPRPAAARTGIVDANMHWLPPTLFSDERLLEAFLAAPPRAYGIHALLRPVPGRSQHQIVIEQPLGHEVLNYAENQYRLDGQIEDMDRAGIERAVFRLPCWQEWLDLDTCRRVNDGLAEHVARRPDRFAALAVAPPWGTRDSLRELERCVRELGFVGVQMAAHYGQLYLDDAAFTPHFECLAALDVPVVVHHTPLPVDYQSILPYTNQRRQFGRCMAQATAVGRELFGGLFDRFPTLKLSHSMLGGGFFAFVEMLFPPRLAAYRDEVDRFDERSERLRRQLRDNLFFDLSGAPQWGRAQLQCAIEVLGAGNVLYGGSYPIRRDWFLQGVDFVRSLGLSANDEAAVLGGNARRLLRLG